MALNVGRYFNLSQFIVLIFFLLLESGGVHEEVYSSIKNLSYDK